MFIAVNLVLIKEISQFICQRNAFDIVAAEIGMDVRVCLAECIAAQ